MFYAVQCTQDTAYLMQWRAHSACYKAITDCKLHRAVEKSSPLWSDRDTISAHYDWNSKQLLTLRWSRSWIKFHLNWGERSSVTMQNPNFVLPLAFSKIVYKPGSKKRSSHPDDTRVRASLCVRGLEMRLHWVRLGARPPARRCPHFPSTLILEKYSYCTHFTSVKHHQPLAFGHWHKTSW